MFAPSQGQTRNRIQIAPQGSGDNSFVNSYVSQHLATQSQKRQSQSSIGSARIDLMQSAQARHSSQGGESKMSEQYSVKEAPDPINYQSITEQFNQKIIQTRNSPRTLEQFQMRVLHAKTPFATNRRERLNPSPDVTGVRLKTSTQIHRERIIKKPQQETSQTQTQTLHPSDPFPRPNNQFTDQSTQRETIFSQLQSNRMHIIRTQNSKRVRNFSMMEKHSNTLNR